MPARKAPMALKFIPPAMPQLVDVPPSGQDWLHEVKFDGYRTQLHIENGVAKALSRSGLEWSLKYRATVAAASELKCRSAIIDGEVYLPDARGASDFKGLLRAIGRHPEQLVFVAFDLMHLEGEDLRSRPIEERRQLLRDLLASAPSPRLSFSEALEADGPEAFAVVEKMGLEGIVSKRAGSRYGAPGAWLKTKSFTTGTFEVIGVERTPNGAPSALLADAGEAGPRFAGQALIALPFTLKDAFWAFAKQHQVPQPPIAGLRRPGATWIEPGLTATVRYLKGEDTLRHATLTGLGMREVS